VAYAYYSPNPGNRAITFTSSVRIVNTGTPVAPVWKTVASTATTSYGAFFDVSDSDGVFERSEGLLRVGTSGAIEQYFFGYSVTFGGGIITTNGAGRFWYYDFTSYGGTANNGGGQVINIQLKDLVVCFVAGTKIRTPEGEKAIEELQIGDLISTGNGAKALKFVCQSTRSFNELLATGKNPIRVAAGTFGATADLLMSPSHAINLEGSLIESGALIDHASVERVGEWNAPELTYFNLELDQHELIWANGVATESYFSSYRTNGFSRQSWDNYSEYVALYGEGELMQELDMPRIAFSRQIPAAVAAKLELNTEAKELALV
jgi:hypothetical protein